MLTLLLLLLRTMETGMIFVNDTLIFGGLTTSAVYGFKWEKGRTLTTDNQVGTHHPMELCIRCMCSSIDLHISCVDS